VVPFQGVSPLRFCTHVLSSPPAVDAQPIVNSKCQWYVQIGQVPQYAVSTNPQLLQLRYEYFLQHLCFQTLVIAVLKTRDRFSHTPWCTVFWKLRGPFEKFVDSPYYSEPEFCGGVVTVYFSKYLPWQAMSFLQRSTHFSITSCRQLMSLFMVGKAQKSREARSGLYGGCSHGVPPMHFFQTEHRIQF
jgi:hypothetical protein